MLELHQFASQFGLPNPSPFCMKVEAYLRLAGIEYETRLVTDPGKGPNGKAPWIVDEGKVIPDSRFIVEYLNRKYNDPLKGERSDEQLAVDHAVTRMLDEGLYWGMMSERWDEPENKSIIREGLTAPLPPLLRKPIFAIAQRGVKRALYGQGTGRLSRDEIDTLGKKDIDTLAFILGDQPYFGGQTVAEIDVTTMAYIAGFIAVPINSEIANHIKTKENLIAYNIRMMKQVFPEFTT